MNKDEIFDDNLLFGFDDEQEKQELGFLEKESKNLDGIYRPSLEIKGVDPREGYKARIRFLRNLKRDGTIGGAAIEKYVHYVGLENYQSLSGYYDCQKNNKEKCSLCDIFWKLKNSNNHADVEKSDLVNRQGKWYSYVLILEDEHQPELVGKVMIFPYTYQIKEKIDDEKKGKITGEPCNIFRFENGKDFRLIIKEKTKIKRGNRTILLPTYESSVFLSVSPIKIWNEKTGKFIEAKLDSKGLISDVKYQKAIKEMLLGRDENINIEDYDSKLWTDEEIDKVNKIISILTGEEVILAEKDVKKSRTRVESTVKEEDFDDIFDDDDQDDDFDDDFDDKNSTTEDDDLPF